MTFTLRQLEYFVAAAQAGKISAAAQDLLVSQSSVTAGIQDIERQVGSQLLARSSRGVRLTEAGRSFLPRAREILRLVDEASWQPTRDERVTGRVRVGTTYTVTGYFLPARVHQLSSLFPDMEVEWVEMDREDVEEALAAGDLDLAVLLTSNLRHPQLRSEALAHSWRRLWFAPGHPLGELEEITLADVAAHPYALLTVDEADLTTRRYWGDLWGDLEPRVVIATASIEAVRSIVANGNGVTILSDLVYRPWSLEGKRIETRRLAVPVPDMTIGLAWHAERPLSRPAEALQDYFESGHRLAHAPG